MNLGIRLFALVCSALLWGCSGDRTKRLVAAHHRAEPPTELFVEVSEAKFLGSPGGWQVLYYDFVWGPSLRGTQKLILLDDRDRYVGYFYLGGALDLNVTRRNGTKITAVFKDGESFTLDFRNGPPAASADGQRIFHRAGP